MGEQPLTELLELHRQGDCEATRRLVQHYAQRLMRLAHKHLASRVKPRGEAEDVVQSVFKSFFVRDSQGQFQIDSSDDLWKLLVTLTVRKARGIWRKNTAGKRDVNRELPQAESDSTMLLGALSREPSIVEALSLRVCLKSYSRQSWASSLGLRWRSMRWIMQMRIMASLFGVNSS